MSDSKIEAFLQDLEMVSAEHHAIIQKIRQLYQAQWPEIEERFIYGGIGFYINATHIGGAYANKNHVNMVFSRGNELSDPNKHLSGKGKFRRHLQLQTEQDLETKHAEQFAAQLINLATQ